jgi:hypothetical protein
VTFLRTYKIAIGCIALAALAVAQTPPAGPKFKDDKEQTEGIAANTEKDPKAKLEKLDKWKADYPETEYAVPRMGVYFQTYGELKMFHEQIQAAQQLRKMDPKLMGNLDLLRTIFADYAQIKPPAADDTAALTDAAQYIIDHADDIFSAANKPQGQTDAQWTGLKPVMVEYSEAQLDAVAEAAGPDAVIARLKAHPGRTPLNLWMGQKLLADAKNGHPELQADMLFHYARAAVYEGTGAQDPANRGKFKAFVDKGYKTFHGSMDDIDKLYAAAKNSPVPDGYKVLSTVDIELQKQGDHEAWCKANPGPCLWGDIKKQLTGDGGAAYFDQVKDSLVPGTAVPGLTKFKGKIVDMVPANRPKKLILAVEKDGVADCTLVFEAALPGNMEKGAELEFEGTVKEFAKEPYMLTLTVDKDGLIGWTGKNAPPARRPAPKKGQ